MHLFDLDGLLVELGVNLLLSAELLLDLSSGLLELSLLILGNLERLVTDDHLLLHLLEALDHLLLLSLGLLLSFFLVT